jgi:hypothetical protein
MDDQMQARAAAIVQRIEYATVATVTDTGRPWNTPLYCAFDDHGAMYWASSAKAQHSRNIERHGEAFLVFFDSTAPEGTGEGVYIEADAQLVTFPEDVVAAIRLLCARVNRPCPEDALDFLHDDALCIYKATPTRIWMNDTVNDELGEYLFDTRVELPLETLHDLIYWN